VTAFYLTHPQVLIDPAVPVPRWGLSPEGRERARRLAASPFARRLERVVSSEEVKAVETAAPLAEAAGLEVEVRPDLHENDRSATGYLPPPEFEATADLFFAHPDESVRGWERAADAQARIVGAVSAILAERPEATTVFVGHGGVGTLLLCHLLGRPIARMRDQPPGGGNLFAFENGRALHGWRALEEVARVTDGGEPPMVAPPPPPSAGEGQPAAGRQGEGPSGTGHGGSDPPSQTPELLRPYLATPPLPARFASGPSPAEGGGKNATLGVRDRLIVALDVESVGAAEALVERLGDAVSFYKIGYRLAFAGGLPFAQRLAEAGKRVFLDLKLHDIGNTVEDGVRSVAGLGAALLTVHAYPQTMRAAAAGRAGNLKILAVTVLTSYDDRDAAESGYAMGVADLVARRAAQARDCGVDGVVCAATEAAPVRALVGPDLLIVTPGVRPAGGEAGDQKRIATPAAALRAGADHLVVGRPITAAPDPAAAARAIVDEMAAAL
jgi:orotidine-5'-phosphate decarboxylase